MPAILLAIISSRVGQLAAAGLVGALWAWWGASVACERRLAQEAAQRAAANMAELSRQQEAARELAAEAATRLVEEQDRARENELIIDQLRKAEANVDQRQILWKGHAVFVSDRPCRLDRDFLGRLRKLRP